MSTIGDLGNLANLEATKINSSTNTKAGSYDLDFSDFLSLMIAQLQNQDPENVSDTSEMLNMLVQMTVVTAVQNITDATSQMYSASLVGKEVTIGSYEGGTLKEIVGTVTATGNYGGQPVVFVDGVSYYLSSIMAIGRLPEADKVPDDGDGDGDGDGENNNNVGESNQP